MTEQSGYTKRYYIWWHHQHCIWPFIQLKAGNGILLPLNACERIHYTYLIFPLILLYGRFTFNHLLMKTTLTSSALHSSKNIWKRQSFATLCFINIYTEKIMVPRRSLVIPKICIMESSNSCLQTTWYYMFFTCTLWLYVFPRLFLLMTAWDWYLVL